MVTAVDGSVPEKMKDTFPHNANNVGKIKLGYFCRCFSHL